VPLSPAAVALLRGPLPLRAANGAGEDWVFPGGRADRPLSNMAMGMPLRRMGRGDLTVHGFRSTFRDWCAEATAHPCEVAEAAYRRGDMLAKRRRLMEEWAEFCRNGPIARDAAAHLHGLPVAGPSHRACDVAQ
jgi:integrase